MCLLVHRAPQTSAQLVLSFCHQPEALALMLAEVKSTETVGPVLIHIITEKGHGYEPAVSASDKMHGVAKYDILTGKQSKPKATVSWHTLAPIPHIMACSLACICLCGPICLSLLEYGWCQPGSFYFLGREAFMRRLRRLVPWLPRYYSTLIAGC